MTPLIILCLGAGVGLGLRIVWRGLRPPPRAIGTVLARMAAPGRPIDDAGRRPSTAGPAALHLLEKAGIDTEVWHRDLEVLERTAMRQASEKLIAAGAGAAGPLAVGLALSAAGAAPPILVVVLGTIGLGLAGFFLPDRLLHDRAESRRRGFRHALSSYLDLVNVLLAGGAGVETALHAAADVGDGWGYRLLRSELRRARLTGRAPWDTFAELGDRIGVSELTELAANVSLAGSHGARIRASLAAKADTLRGHQVAETESDAEAATERMTVPLAVLLLGFLLLISYPAVAQITSVGGPHP